MTQSMGRTHFADLCTLITDGTHDSPTILTSGVPFIKGKHISGGKVNFASCDYISVQDHLQVIARSKPERGDTLFSNIGSVGDAAFVDTDVEFSIKNVALFKPDPTKVEGRYLFYLLRSDRVRDEILAAKSGSAQPFIALGALRKHQVDYHRSLETQRRIASILGAYDDLIEVNRRRVAVLEEMARGLFEEWFVRFRFPGHEGLPFVQTPGGLMPKGWRAGTLGDVLQLEYGKALKADTRVPGPFSVFGSGGEVGHHDEWLVHGPGIIVGRKGNVGAVLWSPGHFWPIDTVFYVRSNYPLSYLFHLLERLPFQNTDAAVPGLNRSGALKIPIVVPSISTCEAYEQRVGAALELRDQLLQANRALASSRDLLLPRLISGQLSVNAAERALEDAA